ncbi:MAG: hypothetical protein MZW92_71860 [Comamonadaceae bacterium]|nr:hypothetical protein [Comamonadaceae bacterium]
MGQLTSSMLRVTYNGKTHWLCPDRLVTPFDMTEYGAKNIKLLVEGEKSRFEELQEDCWKTNQTETSSDVHFESRETVRIRSKTIMNPYDSYNMMVDPSTA